MIKHLDRAARLALKAQPWISQLIDIQQKRLVIYLMLNCAAPRLKA